MPEYETWRCAVGYESGYLVSDAGRVWSLKSKKILKTTYAGRYPFVTLSQPGCNERGFKPGYIHRMVLEAFVGPCPPGMQCRHLDGNTRHFWLSNLCWGTPKSNCEDKVRHGTQARGEKVCGSKMTAADVLRMREMYETGAYSFTDLGRIFGVSNVAATNAVRRYTWTHI